MYTYERRRFTLYNDLKSNIVSKDIQFKAQNVLQMQILCMWQKDGPFSKAHYLSVEFLAHGLRAKQLRFDCPALFSGFIVDRLLAPCGIDKDH